MAAPRVAEVAPLPRALYYHSQSTLDDGRVLVCGGSDSTRRAEVHLYNPETNRWSGAAPMLQPRWCHAQTTVGGGLVLVCGGWTDKESYSADAQMYDPPSDRWTAVAPMKTPRRRHSASTLTDGRAFVCGGSSSGSRVAEVEIYDPRSNSWTQAAPMPVPMWDHTQSTLFDGRVLVCGHDAKGVPTVCTFNPETDQWTATALPTRLVGTFDASQTTLADGRVLVVGGNVDGKRVQTSALYTPTMDNWVHGPDLPSALENHAASMLLSGDVLLSGGSDGQWYQSRVYRIHVDGGHPPPVGQPSVAAGGATATPALLHPTTVAPGATSVVSSEQIRRLEEEKKAAEANFQQLNADLAEARAAREALTAAQLLAANADAAEAASIAAVEQLRALAAKSPRLSLEMLKITKRIGERSRPTEFLRFYGVNSAVFEAVLDGQLVVIKVVYNVEQATDSNLSDTFQTDYALIEDPSKSHPNIVAGLGHFVGEASQRTLGEAWDADPSCVRLNTLFIVMEPMEKPLKKFISDLADAKGGGDGARSAWPPVMPLPVFKVVMQRVLRGLVELLRLGIVHRDLKADNVLINYQPPAPEDTQSQPTMLVKLADFGHALDTNEHPSVVDFKMPYIMRGTPLGGAAAYLAPEVANARAGTLQNPAFIDYSKNDVFAAGMLAHYMLTNGVEDAFATRDPEYTAVHHPNYSAATYSHLPRACPRPIADLVWAMVNPSFEHRITAEEALARVDAMIYVSDNWE